MDLRAAFHLSIAAAVLALLPGCATVFYDRTKTGSFRGKLDVEWVSPNLFIYRPHEDNPLVYKTSDGLEIKPELMYTDGGSIPRLFWSTPLMGPWDFAPGYIIHDWLFKQHHCKRPGWEKIDFDRSATILAEAIKTQMVRSKTVDPTVAWAIYEAVHSPVAEKLWKEGGCKTPPSRAPQSVIPDGRAVVRILTVGE